MHPIPAAPFTAALGETRTVNADQTIRFGSVRYSTPPGLVGREVWVRADGDELVITANLDAGLREVARHRLSTPGNPRIDLSHYPDHPQQPDGSPKPPQPKGRSTEEKAFLALGPGAHSWLVEAAAVGAQRVRSKMTAALELAALVGAEPVDAALGVAAAAGGSPRLTCSRSCTTAPTAPRSRSLVVADEDHSAQPGTSAWASFGTRPDVKTTGEEF